MGIPVARSWPVYRPYAKSAAQQLSIDRFTAAAVMTSAIDRDFVEWYRRFMTTGYGVTWVDMQRATAQGRPWAVLDHG